MLSFLADARSMHSSCRVKVDDTMPSVAFHSSFAPANRWVHHGSSFTSSSSTKSCGLPKPAVSRRSRLFPSALAKLASDNLRAALEESLLASVRELKEVTKGKGIHLYRKSQSEKFTSAAEAVSKLEQSVPGFGASAGRLKSLMPGTWTLIMTDAAAVEKNAGSITGLGSLPGARCKSVNVELGLDGKARTVEAIKVFGGLMDGENTLIGKWRLTGKSSRTLEVTYASALLMGKTSIRADSKAVLETTYCSSKLRVGRSKSGEFYLFVRA